MVGVELVADRATRERFPTRAGPGEARPPTRPANAGLLTRGLLDDILCLAPPFTISEPEMAGRSRSSPPASRQLLDRLSNQV